MEIHKKPMKPICFAFDTVHHLKEVYARFRKI